MTKHNKPTVFVGLSGGVDSSVAAARLLADGFNVVGVFIKVWHPEWLLCNWEAERLDAMRVAAKLDIPFLTCDAEEVYKNDVADYFISEYRAGQTPNPDVMCNQFVKFGAFLDFARAHNADFVATGHYARRKNATGPEAAFQMWRGVDEDKDQTYFLWTLRQEQLQRVLFPVGDTPKSKIRKEADKLRLPTAEKKDSQGICFLGHIDIAEFLSHYIHLEPGSVLDTAGQKIGTHKGAVVYTTGQRHGFVINTTSTNRGPHYVVSRNLDKNTITVDTKPPQSKISDKIVLQDINIINRQAGLPKNVEIQTRYRQKPIPATIKKESNEEIILEINKPVSSLSAGQSCVLYLGAKCLGGGIIT